MQGEGFLAIWSDVDSVDETDYLHWLTREHAAERLGVDGFRALRVFRAMIPGVNRFLLVYELDSPDVLASRSYLERLNAPTPWTQRVMPRLRNFVRGGGRRSHSEGSGRGGFVTALLSTEGRPDFAALAAALVRHDRIAAVHLLQTDQDRTAIRTNEKALREKDASFASLLLIEALDRAALTQALGALASTWPDAGAAASLPAYGFLFAMERHYR